jgi:NADP-dependent 3-hydroxy acid dehydrogenase YdfG
VAAALGPEVRTPAEGLQIAQRVVDREHDVRAAAPVAAVGAALGYVRLTAEGQAAVAARASLHMDLGAVVEHLARKGKDRLMPDDPVFLITGASTGIGAATARHAAEAGYRLVLAARSEDKLSGLADELGGEERAIAVRCDVTEWDDQQALVQRALDTYGRLDVAFGNAGFGGARGFQSGEVEDWKAMVLTNVYGAALTVRAAYDALKASKGHLLLTGSVAGRRALPGSLYSCTKWAVTAMAEAARQELNGTGVRVTLIEPGMVDTPFFDQPPEMHALEADDIARAVMYAVQQPAHVDVNEILVRPTAQEP